MPNTKGFLPLELIQHYAQHGVEFGASSASEYETIADALWSDPKPPHIHECRRSRGDSVRFDSIKDAYSVIDSRRVIRTLFRPIPCISVNETSRAAMQRAGQCHGEVDNLSYFHKRCKQW